MIPMMRLFRILALAVLLVMVDVSAVRGETSPDSGFVSGFVGHAQSYAIDCEVRSAVDWAGFWGVSIGETQFLEALPRTDNPDNGFVGDPNDPWGRIPPQGYGVHADPVAKTLRDYGLNAEARHGLSWDDLRHEIDAGHPAIVWVIGSMWEGTPVEYKASDGHTSRVAAYEHTMTLIGYSSKTIQVVDASSGYLETYRLAEFLDSWAVLGNMAVIGAYEQGSQDVSHLQITTQNPAQNSRQDMPQNTNQDISQSTRPNSIRITSTETTHNTSQNATQNINQSINSGFYTVQRGDWLMALARRFGVNWLELARLNSLSSPYVIYPDQVLMLPVQAEQDTPPEDTSRSVNAR